MRNETAIGYRINAQHQTARGSHGNKEMVYGVVLAPEKRHPINFAKEDMIIVLAEDGGGSV